MVAMSQHPRTPGAFWDAIGWGAQIGVPYIYRIPIPRTVVSRVTSDAAGLRLRRVRQACGLTQGQLAGLAGTHQQTISAYELGDQVIPDETFRALDLVLGGRLTQGEVDHRG